MTSSRDPQQRQAGVYQRISRRKVTRRQQLDDGSVVTVVQEEVEDSAGIVRQERDNRAEAERRGWVVTEPYTDDGRSAFSGKARPAYVRMCEDLKAGLIDAVVVWHEDRLVRSNAELEDLVNLVEATGAMIVTVTAGEVDLTTPEGGLRARIQAAVARKESEDKSRRLQRKMVELRDDGRPNGGPRPYGWQRVGHKPEKAGDLDTRALIPDPDEAPVVREVIERVARGETLTAIGRDLDARGITTPQGNPWDLTNLRRMALNGVHAGFRMHKGVEAGRGDWAEHAIVDEATWRRAVHVLTVRNQTPEGTPKARTARRYLLTGGLLRCGKCGRELRSKQNHRQGRSSPVYVCRPSTQGGCGGIAVPAEPVELLVTEALFDQVESPAFARQVHGASRGDSAATAEAAAIEGELEALARVLGAGGMTVKEYEMARAPMAARLATAQARRTADTTFAAVGRYAGEAGQLRAEWPRKTLDQRQAIVRAVLDHVTVGPVGRPGRVQPPVEDRLTLTWKA